MCWRPGSWPQHARLVYANPLSGGNLCLASLHGEIPAYLATQSAAVMTWAVQKQGPHGLSRHPSPQTLFEVPSGVY